MILRRLIFLFCASVTVSGWAFPCYITLAKDSCWTNYEVTVEVMDANSNELVVTAIVPKGKSWVREPFVCQPGQKLMYQASFKPVFWQREEGKTYMALRYWLLPTEISTKDTAWELPVCYAAAFAGIPFPPDATGNCQCDFTSIPPVKPQ
ncbi:hypothetical protein [Legionella fairfieldensis]|uniref:hypothetical protein n=1 Tax=Legionella fairfieldensis TaxID=45064 RepID=UPI00048D510C|nr:hypothetical protein [Legionella fairfieldensis]